MYRTLSCDLFCLYRLSSYGKFWIVSVSSFVSLGNVFHVSQVFTACHKVVRQMKAGRHCLL